MWHEARKQERKIRGMLVDYRRRAERRQDFYERIKADPTQFMQIHGRSCRIHLDPAVAAAGESAAIIVPWQGQQDNLIDRFDVRAHLDYIPPITKTDSNEPISNEERQCNYERYRILAQNDFLGITEEKFLHQLYLEEQFGANAQFEVEKNLNKKKQNSGVAIGYSYDDDSSTPFSHILNIPPPQTMKVEVGDEDDSDSDIDMDVCIDISKLETSQAHELNSCGRHYGMLSNDFYSFLTNDADEADALRVAREEEHEKMMLSGRKSRRERRAQKERRIAVRPFSPPSYAAKEEPIENVKENESDSRSPSPENTGKITYITSFGGEDELQSHNKISINFKDGIGSSVSYAQKVKENIEKLKKINEANISKKSDVVQRKPKQYLVSRSRSKSRSRNPSRNRSRNCSRTHSRQRDRYRSRSSSREYRKKRRSSRKRSYSKLRKRSRSRSRIRSNSRSNHYRSRSRTHRNKYTSSSSSSTSSFESTTSPSPKPSLTCKAEAKNAEQPLSKPRETSALVQTSINLDKSSESHQTTVQLSHKILKSLSPLPAPEPPPIKRYYGRKRDNESSDSICSEEHEEEESSDHQEEDDANDDTNSDHSNAFPSSATSLNSIYTGNGSKKQYKNLTTQGTSCSNFESKSKEYFAGNVFGKYNPRERLKRKMQLLLNKQYKADKKAEIEKTERQLQQQQAREDEMRELALKLRRRQRELRHKYGSPSPSKDSSEDDPNDESVKKSEIESLQKRRSKSKSLNLRNERSRSNTRSRSGQRSCDRNKSSYRSARSKSFRSSSRSRWDESRRRDRSSRERFRSHGDDDNSRNRHYTKTNSERNYDHSRRYSRSKSKEKFNSNRDYSIRYRERSADHKISERKHTDGYNMHNNTDKDKNRQNKNRIVISAPPKLKKLVDY